VTQFVLVFSGASQPLPRLLSQSPHPLSQVPNVHVPLGQVSEA